jgi:hypothetical protein
MTRRCAASFSGSSATSLVDAVSAPSLSPFALHSSVSLFSASLNSLRNVRRSPFSHSSNAVERASKPSSRSPR